LRIRTSNRLSKVRRFACVNGFERLWTLLSVGDRFRFIQHSCFSPQLPGKPTATFYDDNSNQKVGFG
jgi:hypothetical protein